MKIPFDKKWLHIEKEDYANYLFVTSAWEGYTHLPSEWGFRNARYMGAEYIDSACNLFVCKPYNDEENRILFEWFFIHPEKWDYLHKITEIASKEMFQFGERVKKIDAKKLSNKELLWWLNEFIKRQQDVHDPRGPMFLLETPDNIVTNYLHGYLKEKKEILKNNSTRPSDAFQIMIAPLKKSMWTKEKESLAKVKLIKSDKARKKALSAHTKNFEWLEYGLQGKILDTDYFEEEMDKIKKPKDVLTSFKKEIKDLKEKQRKICKEYNIHRPHQKFFRIIQDSFYTRLFSKDSQFFGYHAMENLFKELGKRGYLTLEQVRFLAPEDYKKILIDGEDLSGLTSERMKYSLHISDQGKTVYYAGQEAREIRKKLQFFEAEKSDIESEELNGQPAFNGKASGRVKIINTMQEMAKMHAGNILVSHMTNPSIVPAMKKALAIVTDLGGITCHAAIVARELKKPCVIGTKVATEVLKDGDMVEVDADNGSVKILQN